ncbi:MAG: hypothetical protein ABSD56_10550 [Bryobacteraceae bacterium]|jgi:hypothetical protein
MDLTMLPAVLWFADVIADNKQLITTILWIAAGAILVLWILRRRKRKMQG